MIVEHKKNKIFIFLGPPGSGKGTLSAQCAQAFGWVQVSTGNLCRDHILRQTELGKQIKSTLEQGHLVADEVVAQMVQEWIVAQNEMPQALIFDGYPRTKNQADLFYSLIINSLKNFEFILIKLNISSEKIIDRILMRAVCSNKDCQQIYSLRQGNNNQPKCEMICDFCQSSLNQRADDTKEILEKRLEVYYEHEQAILDVYAAKEFKIGVLDASQESDIVFNDFKKIVHQNYAY